jgi:hypothetical protein
MGGDQSAALLSDDEETLSVTSFFSDFSIKSEDSK